VAVAAVYICIYCGCTLKVPTRPAHVFPEGLGGRLTTTTTVCDDCNNSFSNIEGQVCVRLAQTGAFAGARRGDRKHVSAELEFQGSKWRVENGRMDELAKPPRDKGRVHPMPARREDQVATVAKALRQRGLPPVAMLDGRFNLEQESDVPPVEPMQKEPIDGRLYWGDRVSKRVMIKVAIELVAYFHAEAARSPAIERCRRFARYDEGREMDFRAGPDTETSGANMPHVDALRFHGIDVWTSGRKLHYRITLFSVIRWVGTLTECWDGLAFSASYTFDVTDPAKLTITSEACDGATLVNKSYRVRARENEDAMARIKATNFANAERRSMRAPKPDFKDLYPDVKALMDRRGRK
jgi:HNH endonuclease